MKKILWFFVLIFVVFAISNTNYPKSVIVYSNIFYTFAFVNDIKKWNKAVRSFVVKTVSNV